MSALDPTPAERKQSERLSGLIELELGASGKFILIYRRKEDPEDIASLTSNIKDEAAVLHVLEAMRDQVKGDK